MMVNVFQSGIRYGKTYAFIKELQRRGIINPTYSYWMAFEEYKKLSNKHDAS